ncbi:MAG: primosomal protein N' [Clostridia bacterium]|nr:primosomal protein N' [Clostridia bacterium]
MCGEYIKVHILDVPYHADREYTYYVPNEFREEIELGTSVVVPFGRSDRQKTAIVTSVEISQTEKISSFIKPISSVLSDLLKLSGEMLELCFFMKNRTLCTIGEAVKSIIPSLVMTKTRQRYFAIETSKQLDPMSRQLYDYISLNGGVDDKHLSVKFENSELTLSRLIKMGVLSKETFISEDDKNKYEARVFLAVSKEEALLVADGRGDIKLRSKTHAEILRYLCEYDELTDKQLYEDVPCQKSQLDSLSSKGLIKIEKQEILRDPYALLKSSADEKKDITLNEEQTAAFEKLRALYSEKAPRGALLYGVTGSGKTSVIKKMIDEVINDGRGVIILVPEISLTPQTVSVFASYYKERVAVIHSSLSAGERFDTYKKISRGEASIVIGTRSAIFAPLKNIGMIVIDEEQEHTYKSDTNPKYSAHDIARFRCAKNNALMLLASATPSLESFYKAKGGTYTLVEMKKRYGDAVLPDVIITDMRKERARGNSSPYSKKLAEYLLRTKEDQKQSILFLNRRGYLSSVSCQSCGEALECPHCSVALTYHSYKKINEEINASNAHEVLEKSGVLRCHYCGYRMRLPEKCKCGESDFSYVGFGTQRAEEALVDMIPDIKTLRLDADTTTSKSSYEKILGEFKNKQADTLIGTQMVTKGHDFPLVTLVGVMLADTMLYTSDYRASEHTFSMITQVIGRAGRARDRGVAIIQTNSPNDQTLILAANQDYDAFYENEIKIRSAYTFPPFCDIALINISAGDEMALNTLSGEVFSRLQEELTNAGAPAYVYGPFEAPIYKAQGRYRKRIIIKCKLNSQTRELFSKIYTEFSSRGEKRFISIDFNPSSL